MNTPHLKPALVAILLLAAGLWSFGFHVGRVERRYIHALALLRAPSVPGNRLARKAVPPKKSGQRTPARGIPSAGSPPNLRKLGDARLPL